MERKHDSFPCQTVRGGEDRALRFEEKYTVRQSGSGNRSREINFSAEGPKKNVKPRHGNIDVSSRKLFLQAKISRVVNIAREFRPGAPLPTAVPKYHPATSHLPLRSATGNLNTANATHASACSWLSVLNAADVLLIRASR